MAVPSSLRLLGRPSTLENSDICGLYVHSGWNEAQKGRAHWLHKIHGKIMNMILAYIEDVVVKSEMCFVLMGRAKILIHDNFAIS